MGAPDSPLAGFDGHPLASPLARRGPASGLVNQFGAPMAPTDDPAWQPPRDPLAGVDRYLAASVVSREIPLSTIQTSWTVPDVRKALADLSSGVFDQPSQLCEAIVGEARVSATLNSRIGGLFGRPVRHTASQLPGVKDSDAAKQALEAWQAIWPQVGTEAVLSELQRWGVMIGFGVAQILWDTSEDVWVPHLRVWHPRYTYYHWLYRTLVAVSLDGQHAVTGGDGHWLHHAPHGEYRGWVQGAVRATAEPWLILKLAYRDFARASERHGMPIILGKRPAAGDPVQAANFRNALANIGQESVVDLPQGVDDAFSYGLDLLESKATWDKGFEILISLCEKALTLSIAHQNLTSEVQEGSLAAARVHADTKQAALESDERGISSTLYQQLARPWAQFCFGDPDLAPVTHWDISPPEDHATNAKTFVDFGTALLAMRSAGLRAKDPVALGRRFGLSLDSADFEAVEPLQIAAKSAVASAPKEEEPE